MLDITLQIISRDVVETDKETLDLLPETLRHLAEQIERLVRPQLDPATEALSEPVVEQFTVLGYRIGLRIEASVADPDEPRTPEGQ